MAYKTFKIEEKPKRVIIKIPEEVGGVAKPLVLDKDYPMAVESEIKIFPYMGIPGQPLDNFKYAIKPEDDRVYSKEINFEINVLPETGSPACVANTPYPAVSGKTVDITGMFPMDNHTDRIRITEIVGDKTMFVNGKPVKLNVTYMRYQFINVTFETQILRETTIVDHATISYQVGNLSGWNAAICSNVLQRADKAEIYRSSNLDRVLTRTTFVKRFIIRNGKPGTNVRLKIVNTQSFSNYRLNDGTNAYEIFNGENIVEVPIGDFGMRILTVSGIVDVDLTDTSINYYATIIVAIEASDGDVTLVDPVYNVILFELFNNLNYDQSNFIYNIGMTSSNWVGIKLNSYSTRINNSTASIDMVADINLFSQKGLAPFVYSVEQLIGNTVTITQDATYDNLWDITGLTGTAGETLQYRFRAKVIDDNDVESIFDFSLYIYKETSDVTVPTVSSPATISQPASVQMSEEITASNNPISYSADNLPNGLSISGNNIIGSVATEGVYNVTLYATNAAGTSVGFACTITITENTNRAPVLTSNTNNWGEDGDPVSYDITYTGTEPVLIVVTNLPIGWYYNSAQKSVKGVIGSSAETFNLTLSNSYGVEDYLITHQPL